jgi:hypothetical protein
MTVFDAVAAGMGEQQAMLAEYEALTGQFGQGDDDALMERMHECRSSSTPPMPGTSATRSRPRWTASA